MVRNTLILASLLFFCCENLFSKDFHFVYIALDKSMHYNVVNEKLTTLSDVITDNNEEFVLLLSNSYPKFITNKRSDLNDVKDMISNTNSFIAIDIYEELNVLLNLFDKYEVCKIVEDKQTNQKYVRPIEKYNSVSFHLFVGDDFINMGYQNSLFMKFLFASDLQLKDFNVDLYYYNTSNLNDDVLKFNNLFRINNIKTHLK